MSQVVDASVVVAALTDDGPAGRWSADRLTEFDLVAPQLMPFEVANVLRRQLQRAVLPTTYALDAVHELCEMAVSLMPFDVTADRVWALGANLTLYDASYVAVAEHLGARLLTLDRRLAGAPGLRCEVLVGPTTD